MITLAPADPDATNTSNDELRTMLSFYHSTLVMGSPANRLDMGSSHPVDEVNLGSGYRVSVARLLSEDDPASHSLVLLDRAYQDGDGYERWYLAGITQAGESLTRRRRTWWGGKRLDIDTAQVDKLARRLHAQVTQKLAGLIGEAIVVTGQDNPGADEDGWPLTWQRIIVVTEQARLAVLIDKHGHSSVLLDADRDRRFSLHLAYIIEPDTLNRRIERVTGNVAATFDAAKPAGSLDLVQVSESAGAINELEALIALRDGPDDANVAAS